VSGKHQPNPFLFSAVVGEVEGKDAFLFRGALKNFWMAQGSSTEPCNSGIRLAMKILDLECAHLIAMGERPK